MSTEEIQCCPFCGGDAASQRFGNRDGGASYAVWCNACHISTPWMHGDDGEQRAIAAWNQRESKQNSSSNSSSNCAAPAAGTEKDAERWRAWKNWWRDSSSSDGALPAQVLADLDEYGMDLDDAMDEYIEASNAGGPPCGL